MGSLVLNWLAGFRKVREHPFGQSYAHPIRMVHEVRISALHAALPSHLNGFGLRIQEGFANALHFRTIWVHEVRNSAKPLFAPVQGSSPMLTSILAVEAGPQPTLQITHLKLVMVVCK